MWRRPGAQIVVAGDQRERRRDPDQHQAELADDAAAPRRPAAGRRWRTIWTAGLPFGELAHRHADPELGQELAQAGDQDLARQDDQRRPARGCRSACPLLDQHQQRRRHQELVGDRIEEAAEARDLVIAAREIAVELVGDAGGDEQAQPTATAPSRGRARSRRRPAGSPRCATGSAGWAGWSASALRSLAAAAWKWSWIFWASASEMPGTALMSSSVATRHRTGSAEMMQQRALAAGADARHLVERRARDVGRRAARGACRWRSGAPRRAGAAGNRAPGRAARARRAACPAGRSARGRRRGRAPWRCRRWRCRRAELGQHLARHLELALAAVDQHQVGPVLLAAVGILLAARGRSGASAPRASSRSRRPRAPSVLMLNLR